MGVGTSTGEGRAVNAARAAITSPLLEASIDGARGILMNIVGGPGVTLSEVTDAANIIHSVAHPDANIIFGSVIDQSIGEAVRVTVIAAGFDQVTGPRTASMTTSEPVLTEVHAPTSFRVPPTTISLTSVAMTISPASFASDEFRERVSANLAAVRRRIAASAPDPHNVRIVAVTKTFGLGALEVATSLGLVDLGENYVDELEEKRRAFVSHRVRWHYLGSLQSNKIGRICAVADVVCGVSRAKELEFLARTTARPTLYVQVDFSGLAGRNGARANEVANLVESAGEHGLVVAGLMTVAEPGLDNARRAFRGTRALANDLGLVECSMGMSEDLEVACELGSTEIRVGRALFGERVAPGTLA